MAKIFEDAFLGSYGAWPSETGPTRLHNYLKMHLQRSLPSSFWYDINYRFVICNLPRLVWQIEAQKGPDLKVGYIRSYFAGHWGGGLDLQC